MEEYLWPLSRKPGGKTKQETDSQAENQVRSPGISHRQDRFF